MKSQPRHDDSEFDDIAEEGDEVLTDANAEMEDYGNIPVIRIGKAKRVAEGNAWDGPDLAQLRTKLKKVLEIEKNTAVQVDMTGVQFPCTGTFGTLDEWREKGYRIWVLHPHERVRREIFFQLFFTEEATGSGKFLMHESFGVPDPDNTRLKIEATLSDSESGHPVDIVG